MLPSPESFERFQLRTLANPEYSHKISQVESCRSSCPRKRQGSILTKSHKISSSSWPRQKLSHLVVFFAASAWSTDCSRGHRQGRTPVYSDAAFTLSMAPDLSHGIASPHRSHSTVDARQDWSIPWHCANMYVSILSCTDIRTSF